MSLEGKVIIVTGAAQGFGRAIALDLAGSKGTLVMCDIANCDESLALVRETGADGMALSFDVTDYSACEAAVKQVVDKYGKVDALVNNGGLYGSLHLGPFEALDSDEWDLVMKVNVKGPWHMCKAVSPHMRAAKQGSIVNIASNSALIGAPFMAHYVASKAALIGLTRTLATELGPDNVRVNALTPGAMNTPGSHKVAGDQLQELVERTPARLKTFLEPEDVTGTVKFLVSDHSAVMTGQVVNCDGGLALTS
jgi:NAD(P)-dependent dehydrogenase (short-subunit alcohol dehydrogenase family)